MADQGVQGITDRRDSVPSRPGQERAPQRRPDEPETPPPEPATVDSDTVIDRNSLLGLALPPQAEAALATLTAEIERLRADLAHAHGHEARLEEEADHHPLLPVLHRRAFHARLNKLVGHTYRVDVPGCVLWLHFPGLVGLRTRLGLAAADAALLYVGRRLIAAFDPADPLGYFEEGDFVAAMLLGTADQAATLRQDIGAALSGAAFAWGEERVDCRPEIGSVALPTDLEVDALLAAAATAAYGSGWIEPPPDELPPTM